MSLGTTDTQYYTDIANAIRTKNGEPATTKYTPAEMATAIEDLPAPATVEKGLVFSDYDSDGYPTKAEFVGSWTSLPNNYCYRMFNDGFGKKITHIKIPDGCVTFEIGAMRSNNALTSWELPNTLTTIKDYACEVIGITNLTFPNGFTTIGSSAFIGTSNKIETVEFPTTITSIGGSAFKSRTGLQTVTYKGNVPNINNGTYQNCSAVTLYDFSNHTGTVPSLYNTGSLGHANGCVIKVPQSLLSTWQTATNWVNLTNVTWQGV